MKKFAVLDEFRISCNTDSIPALMLSKLINKIWIVRESCFNFLTVSGTRFCYSFLEIIILVAIDRFLSTIVMVPYLSECQCVTFSWILCLRVACFVARAFLLFVD